MTIWILCVVYTWLLNNLLWFACVTQLVIRGNHMYWLVPCDLLATTEPFFLAFLDALVSGVLIESNTPNTLDCAKQSIRAIDSTP